MCNESPIPLGIAVKASSLPEEKRTVWRCCHRVHKQNARIDTGGFQKNLIWGLLHESPNDLNSLGKIALFVETTFEQVRELIVPKAPKRSEAYFVWGCEGCARHYPQEFRKEKDGVLHRLGILSHSKCFAADMRWRTIAADFLKGRYRMRPTPFPCSTPEDGVRLAAEAYWSGKLASDQVPACALEIMIEGALRVQHCDE